MSQIKIGLGGFIGAGKSLAGDYFAEKGADVIDSDKIVAELYGQDCAGTKAIINAYGEQFINDQGCVDKSKLATLAYGSPEELEKLNKLIHPLVLQKIEDYIRMAVSEVVVIEAVYFDPGLLDDVVDLIIWINSTSENIKKRVLDRGGDPVMVDEILKYQHKPERIDFEIDNNDSVILFRKKLEGVWNKIKGV